MLHISYYMLPTDRTHIERKRKMPLHAQLAELPRWMGSYCQIARYGSVAFWASCRALLLCYHIISLSYWINISLPKLILPKTASCEKVLGLGDISRSSISMLRLPYRRHIVSTMQYYFDAHYDMKNTIALQEMPPMRLIRQLTPLSPFHSP